MEGLLIFWVWSVIVLQITTIIILVQQRRKSNSIIFKLNKIMANEQQFKDALARVEAATTAGGLALTAIAARITGLEDIIKDAGLPAEVEASLLAQLEGVGANAEALSAALTAMGTVATPVPVPVPDPVEPVEPPIEG